MQRTDQAGRVVRAVCSVTSAPFSFRENGEPPKGALIDLGNAIAAENEWTIEFRALTYADVFPAVATREADIACSILGYTPERAEAVAFGPPHYEGGEGMAVRSEDRGIYATLDDLTGQRVAAVRGTIYQKALEERGGAIVVPFDTNEAALSALARGDVKAHFVLEPVLRYWTLKLHPETIEMVRAYRPLVTTTFHLAVRKDDPDLLGAVTRSVTRMSADGELPALLHKWGVG